MAGDEGGVLSAVTSDVNDDFEDVPLRVPWLAVGVVLGAWMVNTDRHLIRIIIINASSLSVCHSY